MKSEQLDQPLVQRIQKDYEVTQLEGIHPQRYLFTTINQKEDDNEIIMAAKKNQMTALNTAVDSDMDISKIRDEDNRTILHYLALQNNSFVFNRLLIKYKDYATKWLQIRDIYRCQPAHYVAYQGNIELLKNIQKYYSPKNLMGFAAYGNQLQMMLFIQKANNNIFIEDNFNDDITTLHMACFNGSYSASILLMKWKSNVNALDKYNQTPLHICAKNGYPKIIRKLFHRGAQQIQIPNDQIADELTADALNSFRYTCKSVFCQLNIKPSINYTNLGKKSWIQAIIFLLFFTFINGATIYCDMIVDDGQLNWISYLYISIGTICLLTYIILVCSSPGYAKSTSNIDLEELLNQYPVFEICLDCAQYIQPRAKHCEFCKQCISVYDHHCPWVNNCIGKNNILQFLLFIFTLFFNFLFAIALCILLLVDDIYQYTGMQIDGQLIVKIIIILVIVLGTGFLIPLLNLIIVHIINLQRKQTTYERLILDKPQSQKRLSQIIKMQQTKTSPCNN